MKKIGLSAVCTIALSCAVFVTFAIAQDNYSVSPGKQQTTYKSQGGQAPAPAQKSAPQQKTETKTIMLETWPVKVPARVPANTPEQQEQFHAGENAGAAQGLGSGK